MAVPFTPKDSLNVSDVLIEYETSALIELSSEGPILSLITDKPNPILELLTGVLIEKLFVVGAPSKPTHCVLCKPKILKTPREPA